MDNVNTNAYEKIGGVTLDLSWYDGNDYYSEGANEDYLLSLVKEHEESEYDGLILGSRLWSAMYHLKPTRENIVSFLPAGKDMSVLEIGAGCGAVTGALSELFGSVDCIELSRKRSLINAYRHKDRNNIEIIVGNFETIEPSITKKYDYITLIGVLEYAESYISKVSGQDILAPYYELIRRAESHLKEGGRLVVAIENKYGLKYFAGCKEDHTGDFFDGIEGYPKGAGVRTFSKGGLTKLLSSVFPVEQLSFYYPYPDYKLPHVIYSDRMLPGKRELNRNLNNFDNDRIVLFDEEKAFDELIEDGLFPEFSNSFLVIARKGGAFDGENPIYAKFSDERDQSHRIATVITEEVSLGSLGEQLFGKRHVYKKALRREAFSHIEKMSQSYEKLRPVYLRNGLEPNRLRPVEAGENWSETAIELQFVYGTTMEERLDELAAAGQFEDALALIRRYAQIVKAVSEAELSDIDLIFPNILFSEGNPEAAWTVLDYEWTFAEGTWTEASFIIYRALFYYFRERKDGALANYLTTHGIDLYEEFGISREEKEHIFPDREQDFQLFLKEGTTSFELLHEIMPVSTLPFSQLLGDRLSRGNLRNPQVYLSSEGAGGFTSEGFINVLGEYSAADKTITLRIETEPETLAVRIDPTEYACIVKLYELSVEVCSSSNAQGPDEGSKRTISAEELSLSSNGFALGEGTYFYTHNDPQLIISDLPEGKKLVNAVYLVDTPDPEVFEEFKRYFGEIERKREEERLLAEKKASRGIAGRIIDGIIRR